MGTDCNDAEQQTIEATFEVTSWDEAPIEEDGTEPRVTRAVVEKDYRGQITGSSLTQWLMAYDPQGSATFVGLERLTGSIGGREGTVVLQHVGAFTDGAAVATLTIVPGSATGALEGVTGGGDFRADPAGSIQLDMSG
jgi:hypothetical protein